MKRTIFLFISLIFIFSGTAGATVYTFQPNPVDLFDLDHHKYYSWGINWSVPSGEVITGASLFFDNIRNWDNNPNDLWVHLLNSPREGVLVRWDGQGGGNNLAGFGIQLNHWEDLPSTAQDLTYTFDDSEIGFLNMYAADGVWGTGYDPDCHYWNDGVTLSVDTSPVPEPATMLLLGSGLVGLAGFGKRKFKSKKN
jgi:hypothetical protein